MKRQQIFRGGPQPDWFDFLLGACLALPSHVAVHHRQSWLVARRLVDEPAVKIGKRPLGKPFQKGDPTSIGQILLVPSC